MKSVADVVDLDSVVVADLLERLRKVSPDKYERVVLRLSATVHAEEAAADAMRILAGIPQIGTN